MDESQRKLILKETFDAVADGYDNGALRFFSESARVIASSLKLRGDEHILDVACGTGHASLAVAKQLSTGRVTAVDFSSGMLDQARKKAASLNISNVEFLVRDMQHMEFMKDSFDVAICAFGIFFVDDMQAQLERIASMVKSGGKIMISSFQENYFGPLREMFMNRIDAFGVSIPPQTWKRIATEEGCHQLFANVDLKYVQVESKNLGYYLDSDAQWWDIVWNAGFRRMVGQLSPKEQERFKHEHLREVNALRTAKGIWLDVSILFTVGTKA